MLLVVRTSVRPAARRYLRKSSKPGRKRTDESIEARLAEVEVELDSANAFDRLHLYQEQIDLTDELAARDDPLDLAEVETDFVAVAYDYGERKGISYSAWRAAGVEAEVLRQAGIRRTRS
jgi:hypothetical protein